MKGFEEITQVFHKVSTVSLENQTVETRNRERFISFQWYETAHHHLPSAAEEELSLELLIRFERCFLDSLPLTDLYHFSVTPLSLLREIGNSVARVPLTGLNR